MKFLQQKIKFLLIFLLLPGGFVCAQQILTLDKAMEIAVRPFAVRSLT